MPCYGRAQALQLRRRRNTQPAETPRRKDTVRKAYIGMVFLLPMLAALALFAMPASAQNPTLSQLRSQLRVTKQHQHTAVEKAKLAAADLSAALALKAEADGDALATDGAAATERLQTSAPAEITTTLLADGVVTDQEIVALQQAVANKRAVANRWTKKTRALQRRIQRRVNIQRWNKTGNWWPLIKIAGQRYRVDPTNLRQMMMLESGGNRYAGSTYRGLFQYYPRTWRGTWNPWRHQSIYNGWAQIRATAYALQKGMGPSQWPHTYRMAF